jgi:hypothetical protein
VPRVNRNSKYTDANSDTEISAVSRTSLAIVGDHGFILPPGYLKGKKENALSDSPFAELSATLGRSSEYLIPLTYGMPSAQYLTVCSQA